MQFLALAIDSLKKNQIEIKIKNLRKSSNWIKRQRHYKSWRQLQEINPTIKEKLNREETRKGEMQGLCNSMKEDKPIIIGSWRRRGGPFQRQRKYFQQIREEKNPKSKKSITYQSVRLWENQRDKTRNLTPHVTYESKHEMCRAKTDIESLLTREAPPTFSFCTGSSILVLSCRRVWKSYAGVHSCCVFITATGISYPEDRSSQYLSPCYVF